MCSHYLGKNELSNFHVFKNRTVFIFTILFVLDPDAALRALALTVLLKLSSFVSVSDIILL